MHVGEWMEPTARRSWIAALILGLVAAAPTAAAELAVSQAGPIGEVATLAEAGEVRVTFSEPMVALGRIPEPVRVPYFSISPDAAGSFRWSGTRTLIFKPASPLPYATRYEVTIGPGTSLDGSRLPGPYTFSFTTPTLRLLEASWYRPSGRHDGPLVAVLRFNQPVSREGVGPHLGLRYEPHEWAAPILAPEAIQRLGEVDPQAPADFQAKVERTLAAASSREGLVFEWAARWDTERDPPSPDMLVIRTQGPAPPTDAWVRVRIGPKARGVQGTEPAGKAQHEVLKLEPTFFVDGFRCAAACDPDGYNPLRLRSRVEVGAASRAIEVDDVTDAGRTAPVARRQSGREGEEGGEAGGDGPGWEYDDSTAVSLEDAGYSLHPARRYEVTVGRDLTSRDGQTLGHTWLGFVDNWHRRAFSSFGSGHGVWESRGGAQIPFHARNLRSVTQWIAPLKVDDLVPALRRLQAGAFALAPHEAGEERGLAPVPDAIQSYGLDLRAFLAREGAGLFWAALRDGDPIPRAHASAGGERPRSTLLQITNLGISVKDSPQNTLVLVTRLDGGGPVEGARVAIRDLDNAVRWTGVTDASGVALAPSLELRRAGRWWDLSFVITAEKDGDVSYVASDWNQGAEPWEFGLSFDLEQAKPVLRGTVFTDRGVYRLGEEVRAKVVLRSDTARGMALLAGSEAQVGMRDSRGEERDTRRIALNEWSSAEWSFRVPEDAPLGRYVVSATVGEQEQAVSGSFLVAAYRRPDFRVDANLGGETSMAGVRLKGVVAGRYLFGAPMGGKAVRWRYHRSPLFQVPPAVAERFPEARYAFLDRESAALRGAEDLQGREARLGDDGQLVLDLETDAAAGVPYRYTLEGEVTDVSRQALAGRASFRVDPAPWYVGLRQPPFFAGVEDGLETEVVAVGLDGMPVAGVPVRVTLTQVQWHGVRRAEGNGFYTWETERREVAAGQWDVTTAESALPLHVPLRQGGYYVLRAAASDAEGRSTATAAAFYAVGAGYTAWERHDHNRIDLVPEKRSYRPGETARILVKSPWERATALLTTEREGVRTHRAFTLSSTQETVSVPIGEEDVPNVYVSVLLVRGRTGGYTAEDTSDPGKPAYRLGYAELAVEDAAKRLEVGVSADRAEYRPGAEAKIDVEVKDAQGGGAPAEVTLWAVDHGVLSLTGYRTPDVLGSVWVPKALQVLTEDSRQNIISRRVTISKGADEGGGGGEDEGPGSPVRKDFRVLAFWLGSLATDARGRASTTVTLPESLTSYRVMAVAGDKASRFGWGEREIRTSKPVLLRPAFPRFLTLGDAASFGSVVTSQLAEKGTALVTLRSLDPGLVEVSGEATRAVEVGTKGSAEVRFDVRARAVGRARLQMAVRLLGESDAFEEVVPVQILVSPEVVAAHGQTTAEAREALELPDRVVPSVGGLHLELSSTALTGLGEGARYLVDYPYGCAEQRASAAHALVLSADLGDAFRLPGLEPGKLKGAATAALRELRAFQCDGGGFAFWKGDCRTVSPYLTSYLLHVLRRAGALGHEVPSAALENGYGYLEQELSRGLAGDEGARASSDAWQAFAVKVLAEGGRAPDSAVTRLVGRLDRLPVFALAYLRDALAARGEAGEVAQELDRRIRNAILPEGGSAHVEEVDDPRLRWLWSSDVRSTALVLGSLVRSGGDETLVPGLVRWLLAARRGGRWGNTQDNAVAMEALVDYYRLNEAEEPAFEAAVGLGAETLASARFHGRSTSVQAVAVALRDLLARGARGNRLDLSFTKEGAGILFYTARLRYAPDLEALASLDQGFAVERRFRRLQGGDDAPAETSFQAGELVRVTLRFRVPKERRFVAVADPLPAGFEPVESWFATTASDLARAQQRDEQGGWEWWRDRGGFDHVERHDDRVLLFATRLAEGAHEFSYVVRATTAGTFRAAPARAEEMYEPEVFGRTASEVVAVRP